MADDSNLDQKYFIDSSFYNCPFCNRRNLHYQVTLGSEFNWNNTKKCYVYFVRCSHCGNDSMHLSYTKLDTKYYNHFDDGLDLDSLIFYSVPTSFFTVDERIPKVLRELITEAEGSLKMNYLTGASACIRKAIYEFLVISEATEKNYEDRIKEMKVKFPVVDSEYFDELSHLQGMTSDKVHEGSWEKWDSSKIKLLLETLRNIFYEIYVLPDEKKQKRIKIQQLREEATKSKKPVDKKIQ